MSFFKIGILLIVFGLVISGMGELGILLTASPILMAVSMLEKWFYIIGVLLVFLGVIFKRI